MFLLIMVGVFQAALSFPLFSDSTLVPKEIYGKEARVVTYILDSQHFRRIKLNDSISSVILDEYVKNLDNAKTYFLASDIAAFEKFRYILDDKTKNEDVTPAYEIYSVFRDRFKARMAYVLNSLVVREFDYTLDEEYESNRDHASWAKSEDELNEVWRKIIKSQALSLKLSGKKTEEISKLLKERYERILKFMLQYNSEDVFSLYLNTLTEAYDPHTNYFSPKAADVFKQSISLSLEGIGARLQTENDYTKVAEIIPGGPAEKSDKIHVNDRIIGVAQGKDGEMVDVIGWRIDEVVKLIKGPKGTTVRLQILPAENGLEGPSREIILVRDKIKLEDQRASKSIINYDKSGKNYKLGVITLPSFYMDFEEYQKGNPNYTSTTRDVKNLIKELEKEKISGIVLDLRNNGGGSLAEAIDLTGLFIAKGPVVQVKNSANRVEIGMDEDPAVFYNGPLVVLTNRFSVSASEIFAGAIQDYRRGIVVGESTFGKGTVQTVVDLNRFIQDPNEHVGELKITFQKFYRVTGSSTQHKGVTPDILLPSALDPEEYGESSSPSALPWDEIKGTLYQKTPLVSDKLIAYLNKDYKQRMKSDGQLSKFVADTQEIKKNMKQTRVSLNEEKRRNELKESERRKENSSLSTKVNTLEGKPTENLKELDDEYLREGILVLTDIIFSKIG